MYKGNKRDFIENLNVYLQRSYGISLNVSTDGLNIVNVRKNAGMIIVTVERMRDAEDYEQQIYDFVNNKILKDVQR